MSPPLRHKYDRKYVGDAHVIQTYGSLGTVQIMESSHIWERTSPVSDQPAVHLFLFERHVACR